MDFLKNKKIYCANQEEKVKLIDFFTKWNVPMNPVIPNSKNPIWEVYYLSDSKIEAHGKYGDYINFNEFINRIKNFKIQKWKMAWKDL